MPASACCPSLPQARRNDQTVFLLTHIGYQNDHQALIAHRGGSDDNLFAVANCDGGAKTSWLIASLGSDVHRNTHVEGKVSDLDHPCTTRRSFQADRPDRIVVKNWIPLRIDAEQL